MEMLQNNFLPLVNEHHRDDYLFMQDGAPGHAANVTKVWFQNHNMEMLQ